MSAEGVCGASPLGAPSGLPLRSAPRRAQRAAREQRARNERGACAQQVWTSLVRQSVGSVGSVGRVVRVGRAAVGRVGRVGRSGRSGRSAVGRSHRAVRLPAPIGTARGGRPVRARRRFRGGALGGTRGGHAAAGAGAGQCRSRPKRGRGSAKPLIPSTARARREHGAGGPKQAEGDGGPKGKPRRGPAAAIGAGERPRRPRGPPRTAARRE